MSGLRDRCPGCSRRLIITRFDTTFRLPDRTERLCFGIPGGLCEDCHQLYIDPELIELLDLGDGRCVFAIESDIVLQEAGLVLGRLTASRLGGLRPGGADRPAAAQRPRGPALTATWSCSHIANASRRWRSVPNDPSTPLTAASSSSTPSSAASSSATVQSRAGVGGLLHAERVDAHQLDEVRRRARGARRGPRRSAAPGARGPSWARMHRLRDGVQEAVQERAGDPDPAFRDRVEEGPGRVRDRLRDQRHHVLGGHGAVGR